MGAVVAYGNGGETVGAAGGGVITQGMRIRERARAAGCTHVSASHDVSPFSKFVPRGQTSVADAYLYRWVKKIDKGA